MVGWPVLISGCRRGISHILFPLDFVTFVQISEPAHSPRELLPRKFRRHLRLHRSPRIEREPRTVLPQSLLRAMLAHLDLPGRQPIHRRRRAIIHDDTGLYGAVQDGSDTGGGE